jgi:hypothetical protein
MNAGVKNGHMRISCATNRYVQQPAPPLLYYCVCVSTHLSMRAQRQHHRPTRPRLMQPRLVPFLFESQRPDGAGGALGGGDVIVDVFGESLGHGFAGAVGTHPADVVLGVGGWGGVGCNGMRWVGVNIVGTNSGHTKTLGGVRLYAIISQPSVTCYLSIKPPLPARSTRSGSRSTSESPPPSCRRAS